MNKDSEVFDHNGFTASLKLRMNNAIGKDKYRLDQLILIHRGRQLNKIICKITIPPNLKAGDEMVKSCVKITAIMYNISVGLMLKKGPFVSQRTQYKLKEVN